MTVSPPHSAEPVTPASLAAMKAGGQPIACLTAYEASFARLMDRAMTDLILVGDSLGTVVQGHDSTVPVAVDDIVYHCRCVKRGIERAFLMADMPLAGLGSHAQALHNARRIMREGGAAMVKIETDENGIGTIRMLHENSVPVCAHIGLLPQKEYHRGRLTMRGKTPQAAAALLQHARQCVAHGAGLLLVEYIAFELARRITREVPVPVIGIGSGPHCDGQILVMHDIIGASKQRPKFAHDFLHDARSLEEAFGAYVAAVKAGRFPAHEGC